MNDHDGCRLAASRRQDCQKLVTAWEQLVATAIYAFGAHLLGVLPAATNVNFAQSRLGHLGLLQQHGP